MHGSLHILFALGSIRNIDTVPFAKLNIFCKARSVDLRKVLVAVDPSTLTLAINTVAHVSKQTTYLDVDDRLMHVPVCYRNLSRGSSPVRSAREISPHPHQN
ncbi:hypothetical protein HBH56_010200 [Parastagonospora nodorum]|uniref:Uncharacterized protein n=1 Tax=Phaeosphaeria nodorum (strain SN15 / ATCC MYA-4574 / FGSC 10173) TaxID=321614 RepID=A0A7U2ETB2_PHANO|nr:hypothetical protein HBH56_010200 [Parastagonospora nodorum]QRC90709.1 hypothetical protein JI435_425870 [Parastagonospora nodorum SN15]KAH3935100.1 hypothetical protein HBH54_043500 [Parastagonospora nodorum]KAH3943749.1 hypothetical protein HBH53_170370 [Parastagonospora nodorum]KAH3987660.1 hypothetical protein HBH52_034070 [Parastagonospora nodorum]